MHGSIDVQSEQGKGSVFTVTLDLPVADSIVPDIILPNITMILIDDDQVFLESATDTMKQIGIDADVADSGRKGLEMIRDRHQRTADYQVVILDWKMPDMDGVAVTRAIRAEIGADVPIIIVSAYDYTEIEDEALAVGANGFISKPLFKSSVCRTLNDFFGSGRKEAPTQEHYSLEGMRILVAEDNDVNYEIAEYLLEDEGAQCSRAENGKICVEMLEQGEGCAYDLVLMDIQMPVLKGIDATKLIRNSQKECIRNIPIIAMTADAFAENIEECRNAGMDGHIAKPIDMTIVLNEIEHVMQRTQANRGDV
jgi:CheY-like chemotaxis protein